MPVIFTYTEVGPPWGSADATANTPTDTAYPGATSSVFGSTGFSLNVVDSGGRAANFSEPGTWTATRIEGGGWDISPALDMSSGILVGHFKVPGRANLAYIALRSGIGNWRTWEIYSSSTFNTKNFPHENPNGYYPFSISPNTPGSLADIGEFDPDLVDRIEVLMNVIDPGSYDNRFDNFAFVTSLSLTGGTSGSEVSLDDIASDPDISKGLVFLGQGTGNYISYLPFSINADAFLESFTLRFPVEGNPSCHYQDTDLGIDITVGASNSLDAKDSIIQSARNIFITTSVDATANANFNRIRYAAPGLKTFDANYIQIGGSFLGAGQITCNGTLSGVLIANSAATDGALLYNPAATLSNLSFQDNPVALEFASTSTDYDISSFTFTGNTVDLLADGVAATATATGAQSSTLTKSEINSGSITLSAPTTSLTGPNIVDPTYPIGVTLLRQETFVVADISTAINTTTDTITIGANNLQASGNVSFLTFIPQGSVTLPELTGGGAIASLGLYFVESVSGNDITISTESGGSAIDFSTTGSGTFVIRAWTKVDEQTVAAGSGGYSVDLSSTPATYLLKARGFQNSSGSSATKYLIKEISWSGSPQSVPDTLSFTDTPDEVYNSIILDSKYTNDGSTVTGLTFDLSGTVQIDITGGGNRYVEDLYAWAVYYTSTAIGREFVGDVFQALNKANFQVSPPVQVENVNSGTLVNLIGAFLRRSDGGNLVYHGATSGSVVLAPEQLAVPYEYSVGSGLSTDQNAILSDLNTRTARLDGLIEDSSGDRFTAKALETASGGSGLDAAGVRAAIGLAAANLDTQLGDIPTVAEFEARTLAAADYFDPASDTVANVATVATTTDLTNLPSIPTNWLTAAGLAADAVAEIQSGLSTLTAADVWGYSSGDRTLSGLQSWSTSGSVGSIANVTFPANFADLAIAPTTGTVTAGNMRGTDNALLAASYTAPLDALATQTAAANAISAASLATSAGQTSILNAISALPAPSDATLANQQELLDRLTLSRAGYLDALNVAGTLAHTGNADTFKADVTALPTSAFNSSDRTLLTRIDKVSRADEKIRDGSYQKLDPEDGVTVLVDKAVTTSGNDIDLVEAP